MCLWTVILYVKELQEDSSKFFLECSKEKKIIKANEFGMSWGWVNSDRIVNIGRTFLMHLTETKYGQWGDRTKWSQRVHYGSVARGETGPLCWSIQLFHIHLSDWSLNVCYISIGTEPPPECWRYLMPCQSYAHNKERRVKVRVMTSKCLLFCLSDSSGMQYLNCRPSELRYWP